MWVNVELEERESRYRYYGRKTRGTPTLVAEEVDITAATLWPLLLLLLGLGKIVVLEAVGKVDVTATTLVSSCPVTI